jgi:hypothetical protein
MVLWRSLLVDWNMCITTSNLNGSKDCLQNIGYAKYNQDIEWHMTRGLHSSGILCSAGW